MAQVFELRETPEPTIIMAYYPHGNMMDARVLDEARRMSGFGQVLEALSHLHAKGVVHRDLKPENFLVELEPYFKVVITDFGLANVVIDNAWLRTFCGSLKYMAPEVFPGLSKGHGPLADVWSMGVIGIEWIYNIPAHPHVPTPEEQGREIPPKIWSEWVTTWAGDLLDKLNDEDEDGDQLINMLFHMVQFRVGKRWSAKKCLMQGLNTGLLKRRKVDGLIVCANYRVDLAAGSTTPTPPSPSIRASPLQSGINPDATTILENL